MGKLDEVHSSLGKITVNRMAYLKGEYQTTI